MAWFQKFQKFFTQVNIKTEVYDKINSNYTLLNKWSYSATSKSKYLLLTKELKGNLVKLQTEIITNPNATINQRDNNDENINSLQKLVHDAEMQQIIYCRYKEIKNCVRIAPLAATVMMGGLLEALFLARINKLPDKRIIFKQATTPIDQKTKKPKNLSEWTLSNFIDISFTMGWVRRAAKDVGVNIMEYRNLIHPEKQLRLKISLEPEDSQMFWVIFNELIKQIINSV